MSERPTEAELRARFEDMHPPLDRAQALIEADRCYFCYDAPCTDACPTGIDIPLFIQRIRSGNIEGSAEAILSENIMGGMCARVCPTEVLCEEKCVRNTHEDKPVAIGLLQRHATDPVIDEGKQLFRRAPRTGKRVAVVGAGPAGLACAHRLAMLGHDVELFEGRPRMGGLNEYGIAAYKTVDGFAQREVDYILGIGGIERRQGALGREVDLEALREVYDAVFLGVGLGDVNDLTIEGADSEGVYDAVDYIADLRQANELSKLPVGEHVVVIGGGMTAIDIAVQSKKLGAQTVTMVYRRGAEHMNASVYEQDFAQKNGVLIRHWLSPDRIVAVDGKASAIVLRRTRANGSGLETLEEEVTLPADAIFKAIGQKLALAELGRLDRLLETEGGRVRVDAQRRTSLEGVWAGGDCVHDGEDLTVSAVQDGKLAAISIDQTLRGDHG